MRNSLFVLSILGLTAGCVEDASQDQLETRGSELTIGLRQAYSPQLELTAPNMNASSGWEGGCQRSANLTALEIGNSDRPQTFLDLPFFRWGLAQLPQTLRNVTLTDYVQSLCAMIMCNDEPFHHVGHRIGQMTLNGISTDIDYSCDGQITEALGLFYTYDDFGRLLTVEDTNGPVENYIYDALGRLAAWEDLKTGGGLQRFVYQGSHMVAAYNKDHHQPGAPRL